MYQIFRLQQYYDLKHPKIIKTLKNKEQLVAQSNDSSLPEGKRSYARALLKMQWYKGGHPRSEWQLQKIRLNDKLQILVHSGEPTSELGRIVKDHYPDKVTIFLGYSWKKGYISSSKQELEGGYEAKGYKDAEKKILDTFDKLKAD